jgi:hypothetical protein
MCKAWSDVREKYEGHCTSIAMIVLRGPKTRLTTSRDPSHPFVDATVGDVRDDVFEHSPSQQYCVSNRCRNTCAKICLPYEHLYRDLRREKSAKAVFNLKSSSRGAKMNGF